jgi:hypothetical protein
VWELRTPPAHIKKAKIFAPEDTVHMWRELAER